MKTIAAAIVALSAAEMLSGCGMAAVYDTQKSIGTAARTQVDTANHVRPIVVVHEGSWLLGKKIAASTPQPAIFSQHIRFTPSNRSSATLAEVADHLTRYAHLHVVIDSSVDGATGGSTTTTAANGGPLPPGTRTDGAIPLPGGNATMRRVASAAPVTAQATGGASSSGDAVPFEVFNGDFGAFINEVDSRFRVWSHLEGNTLTFLRSETRTFPLPTLPDEASMEGSISTGVEQGSVGAGGSVGMSVGGSSGAGAGGQVIKLKVAMNPWKGLQDTAQAVGGPGALVHADQNLGVLTVTGTPPQCDRVDQFMRGLGALYGKQIAIDVHVYQVQETLEHNYGANLKLAYTSSSGHTGLTLSGASIPTITSTSTPMTFGATILGGSLDGTSATIQALATLGNVSEVISRAGVTQNGKILALQAARQEGYVESSQSTATASVGSSTTLQTGTLVPGFTSSFIPKLVDGKVQMAFDMTLSDLLALQTFTSGSGTGQSSVQLPTMQVTRFQQIVSLKPGETLILTGMRQQSTNTTNNGVGSPYMPILGGGVDAQKNDTIIAVAITAKLM
ncbi:pilus assembly protein PilN [Paraburkholderia sp. J8-2]|uniref:pilus assembly protein PilN n=1 Tax=Paraburkholderia sp. J8-2 TaxID=2805440 RepID=UPI002AB70835|nr:pilus assembly protein PilN [Paraburkholderia sp. J8-2]